MFVGQLAPAGSELWPVPAWELGNNSEVQPSTHRCCEGRCSELGIALQKSLEYLAACRCLHSPLHCRKPLQGTGELLEQLEGAGPQVCFTSGLSFGGSTLDDPCPVFCLC